MASIRRRNGRYHVQIRKNGYPAITKTFIHREHELIQGAAETGIPMLGICFGHQILASALCGRNQIFRRQTCEVGYRWLDVKPGAVDDSMAQELEKDGAVIDDLNRSADEAVTAKTMLTRFTDIVSGRSG
jgi:GMP synthase-like glutamine amidotransferase